MTFTKYRLKETIHCSGRPLLFVIEGFDERALWVEIYSTTDTAVAKAACKLIVEMKGHQKITEFDPNDIP